MIFDQTNQKLEDSSLNRFIPYVLKSTIVLHLQVNIYDILNDRWLYLMFYLWCINILFNILVRFFFLEFLKSSFILVALTTPPLLLDAWSLKKDGFKSYIEM